MSIAFLLLLVLITAAPGFLIVDDVLFRGIAAMVIAGGLAVTAASLPAGEAGHLVVVLRPALLMAAIPAVWMLIQVLPLAVLGLAHPAWQGAADALGPMGASISIAPGATVMALVRYVATLGILVLAAAVAVDRGRAEQLLLTMAAVAGFTAVLVIATTFAPLAPVAAMLDRRDAAADSVALGVILSAAAAIHGYERLGAHRQLPDTAPDAPVLMLTGSLAALVLCLVALALVAAGPHITAVGAGIVLLLAAIAIRRLGPGPWGVSAIAASVMVAAFAVAAVGPAIRAPDLTLAFTSAPAWLVVTTQRLIADVPATGIGAGAFAALAPIYRGIDDPSAASMAPTSAAAMAVELGRPMLLVCIGLTLAGVFILLRGALRRGRDAIYSAAGAGSLVTALFLAFGDNGLSGTSPTILAAGLIGLAFAQRAAIADQTFAALHRFLAASSNAPNKRSPRVPAGLRVYAIGDVHGRADLLAQTFARIDADFAARPVPEAVEILLGDYVDRGPDSRAVIEALITRRRVRRMVCLKGNHEALLLSFLGSPTVLEEWRHCGGLETLIAYGVVPMVNADRGAQMRLAASLDRALPHSHRRFLQSLRRFVVCGDFLFVHAGVRPGIALRQQREVDLLGIREDFLLHEGTFGKIVVHGHTPVHEPEIRANRINIDTGAFATGRLTCLAIEGEDLRFL